MKNTLLALLLLISSFAFSQRNETTYQVQAGIFSQYAQKWNWNEALNEQIDIKLEGSSIYIYNKNNTVITTYEDLGEKRGYDDDNDAYKTHTWLAYDNKNRKCKFMMTWYESDDLPIMIYSVIYNDVAFRYYIRRTKLSNF